MTEELARECFENFTEDLDPKIKKEFIKMDRWAYYYIMTVSTPWIKRPMMYRAKDVDNYSFKELYNQMCDLFYDLEEGNKTPMWKIILLKNFINYKLQYGGEKEV